MEQAMREKQIPRAFARINNVLDELDKETSSYGDTLMPILTPPMPEGSSDNKLAVQRETLAPLAETLETIENRIRSIKNKIQFLRQRTEV